MPGDMTEPPYLIPEDDDPHYTVIGLVASKWATLEVIIDGCIASLALCGEPEMACVTAQLIGPAKRMDALLALFVHRGGSERLRKRIKSFQGKIQQLGEDRNRIVHDPLLIKSGTGKAHKVLSTAKGELKYEMVPVSINGMKKTADQIEEAGQEFRRLREEIDAEITYILQEQLKRISEVHPDQNPPDENP